MKSMRLRVFLVIFVLILLSIPLSIQFGTKNEDERANQTVLDATIKGFRYANPHQDRNTLEIYFTRYEPNGDADILAMNQDGTDIREVFADPEVREVQATTSNSGEYTALLYGVGESCSLSVFSDGWFTYTEQSTSEAVGVHDCESLFWSELYVQEQDVYADALYSTQTDGTVVELILAKNFPHHITQKTFYGDWPKGSYPLVHGGHLVAYQSSEGVVNYHEGDEVINEDDVLEGMHSPTVGVSTASILGECETEGHVVLCEYYSIKDTFTVHNEFLGEDFEVGFTVESISVYRALEFMSQVGFGVDPSLTFRTSLFFVREGQIYALVYASNQETCLTCSL